MSRPEDPQRGANFVGHGHWGLLGSNRPYKPQRTTPIIGRVNKSWKPIFVSSSAPWDVNAAIQHGRRTWTPTSHLVLCCWRQTPIHVTHLNLTIIYSLPPFDDASPSGDNFYLFLTTVKEHNGSIHKRIINIYTFQTKDILYNPCSFDYFRSTVTSYVTGPTWSTVSCRSLQNNRRHLVV
jgi:hypothetical protein